MEVWVATFFSFIKTSWNYLLSRHRKGSGHLVAGKLRTTTALVFFHGLGEYRIRVEDGTSSSVRSHSQELIAVGDQVFRVLEFA